MLKYAVVGSPETVRPGLEEIVELTGADELMVVSAIYDQDGAAAVLRDPRRGRRVDVRRPERSCRVGDIFRRDRP